MSATSVTVGTVQTTSGNAVNGLDCVSTTDCYGTISHSGVVPIPNGTLGTTQAVAGVSKLSAISCPTATRCYVTGDDSSEGTVASLLVNGGSIAPNPATTIPAPTFSRLTLACRGYTGCVVSGGAFLNSAYIGTFTAVNANPTASLPLRFRVSGSTAHRVFSWRTARTPGIAGFQVLAHGRPIGRFLPVHRSSLYRETIAAAPPGPYRLRVVFGDGHTTTVGMH